ncbi:MAG: hypothetical protein K2P90_03800 [Holosporales bacterium]|nr:hypothetical protein [Holosporales bacterium]
MKKNFLSCFFLAAFLWGQTAPVMANSQGNYLEVSQSDEDTGYKARLFYKNKKAIITVGTPALLAVAVGGAVAVAAALGVFSGAIINSTNSTAEIPLNLSTSVVFPATNSPITEQNISFPLPSFVTTMNPGTDYLSLMTESSEPSSQKNKTSDSNDPTLKEEERIDPSLKYISRDCPSGYLTIKDIPFRQKMHFPRKALGLAKNQPLSFYTWLGQKLVQDPDDKEGMYTYCAQFQNAEALRKEPLPSCPRGSQHGRVLFGPNSTFTNSGYLGTLKQMGTYEFVRDAGIGLEVTRGLFQDKNGKSLVMYEGYGRIRSFILCETSSDALIHPCSPNATTGRIFQMDRPGDLFWKDNGGGEGEPLGFALGKDNYVRECIHTDLSGFYFRKVPASVLDLNFTDYFVL